MTTFQGLDQMLAAGTAAHGKALPTLVIGLGGSGVKTARRVKRLVLERYGAEALQVVKFVLADCDQTAYNPAKDLAPAELADQASVVARDASGVFEATKKGQRPNIAEWLPANVSVNVLARGTGAGGQRPIGRFALFTEFQSFYNTLQQTCQSLMTLQAQIRQQQADNQTPPPLKVYLINSLAGGAGSSIFLDVAMLSRDLLGGVNGTDMSGVFFMPSVFELDLANNAIHLNQIQVNGYGALRELEYFASPDSYQSGAESIWSVDYGANHTAKASSPLFDTCFVVERRNEHGKLLSNSDEVFEMTARSIAMAIDATVGSHIRAYDCNVLANMQAAGARFPDGETPVLHSFATTSLHVPIAALARYGGTNVARTVVHDLLLGAACPINAVLADATKAVTDARLHLLGKETHAVGDLEGGDVVFNLGTTRQELEAEATNEGHHFETGRAHFVGQWIEHRRQGIEQEFELEHGAKVRTRQQKLWADARVVLRQLVHDALLGGGVAEAVAVLEEAVKLLSRIADSTAACTAEYESGERSRLQQAISEKTAWLSGYGSLFLQIFTPHADEHVMEQTLNLLATYGTGEYRRRLQGAAYELLTSANLSTLPDTRQPGLVPMLKAWLEIARLAKSRLEIADGLLANAHANAMPLGEGNGFVLDQSLLSPEEWDPLIEAAQVSAKAVAVEVRANLGESHRDAENNVVPTPEEYLARLAVLGDDQQIAQHLADSVAVACTKPLLAWLDTNATFLRVLEWQAQRAAGGPNPFAAVNGAEPPSFTSLATGQLLHRAAALAAACVPFWRPGPALNAVQQYETYASVAVPVGGNQVAAGATPVTIQQQIGGAGQYNFQFVPTEERFTLSFVLRRHGCRAYHMTSIADLRRCYAAAGSSRSLSHIDKRFVTALPELEPQPAWLAPARLAFAWGLAYGYVAKRGAFYYAGADGTHPRYASELAELVVRPEDVYTPMVPLGTAPAPADRLGQGRGAAMAALLDPNAPAARDTLTAALQTYEVTVGSSRVRAELAAYMAKLALQRGKGDIGEQVTAELEALEAYLKRLT